MLLLAAEKGRGQTVYWSDGFETNTPGRWTATGAWHIGSPTTGTHYGANCATTQNYSYNQDGRIACTKYLNGSNSLVIPDASVSPTLIFWHWVNLANALGYVELKSGTNDWQQISPTYLDVTSGGVWLQESIDLSAFAGQSVQIAFHFTSGGCCGNAKGWYVDDVSLTVVVTTPPQLIVPDTQTIYAGQTLTVTNSATNSFLPNAKYTFRLLSPPANATIITTNNVGVLTWATTNTQLSSSNTITVKVTDNSSPALSTTNSFAVVVVNPWQPVLTVPGPQTIYAGQTLTVTNYATNTFFPNTTFTFALRSGLTNDEANLDLSDLTNNGVVSWATTTALEAGTYTNVIKVTDNGAPYLSATNSFKIVVSNPPPPIVTVPPTQAIYVGQTLDVFISAANSAYPDCTFTFDTNSAPAGVSIASIDPNTGELTWTPDATQAPNIYTISVTATDDNSPPLSATNSFLVIVSSTLPPPVLTVPGTQTIHAGQTLTVTTYATNSYLPDAEYTFELLSPPANASIINTNNVGVLTWATTTSQPSGTNTITVKATDDSVPPLSATNSFAVVVLNPSPPTLIVPPTQKLYAGQTLIVTNYATSIYPSNTFNFTLVSTTFTNMNLNPTNGVLCWATTTNQPAGTNQIIVMVSDSVTLLSTTTNFLVVVKTNPPPPLLLVPPTQTIYAGQTLTVTNYAYYTNSVFLGSSAFTYSLVSTNPAGVVLVTTNGVGVLTWATTTAQPAGTYTNVIRVVDSLTGLSATTNFLVQVLSPQPPTLIVPPTQTIYALQTLVVTNHATSVYPNSTFSFAAFGPTNMDVSNLPKNGVLKWTPTPAQAPSTNTIYVQVTDNNSLSTISNFLVVVLPPQPPTLFVPPTQIIYPGQTLIVTNHATSIYSNNTFTFALLSGPANMDISKLTNNGVLKWTPTSAQASSPNTIYVMVTDNNSLSATNHFLVLVPTPPPPGFTASPRQTLTINGFQFTLNTTPDTIWRIDASTNLSNWQPFLTNTADSSGTIQCTDLLATNFLQRFYRAVWQ